MRKQKLTRENEDKVHSSVKSETWELQDNLHKQLRVQDPQSRHDLRPSYDTLTPLIDSIASRQAHFLGVILEYLHQYLTPSLALPPPRSSIQEQRRRGGKIRHEHQRDRRAAQQTPEVVERTPRPPLRMPGNSRPPTLPEQPLNISRNDLPLIASILKPPDKVYSPRSIEQSAWT